MVRLVRQDATDGEVPEELRILAFGEDYTVTGKGNFAGAKVGTYKLMVKVTAGKTTNTRAASKTVTVTVKVTGKLKASSLKVYSSRKNEQVGLPCAPWATAAPVLVQLAGGSGACGTQSSPSCLARRFSRPKYHALI